MMNSPRMLGLANDQHIADLKASAARTARSSTARREPESPSASARNPIRRRTGWALVSVGLWLASADR
jgi:hypothetical protein